MGIHTHHVVIVTGTILPGELVTELELARRCADKVGLSPSPILQSGVNGVGTFMVPPSGSYAGRDEARKHAERSDLFLDHLRSTSLDWLWVVYGEGAEPVIMQSNVNCHE